MSAAPPTVPPTSTGVGSGGATQAPKRSRLVCRREQKEVRLTLAKLEKDVEILPTKVRK